MPPMPGYESRRGLVASGGGWANATASGVNSQIRTLDPRFPQGIRRSGINIVGTRNGQTTFNTLRHGGGAPDAGLGVDGDFYIDTTGNQIFGPKAGGAWGTGRSIRGTNGREAHAKC